MKRIIFEKWCCYILSSYNIKLTIAYLNRIRVKKKLFYVNKSEISVITCVLKMKSQCDGSKILKGLIVHKKDFISWQLLLTIRGLNYCVCCNIIIIIIGIFSSIWEIKFWIWWYKYLDFTKNAQEVLPHQRRSIWLTSIKINYFFNITETEIRNFSEIPDEHFCPCNDSSPETSKSGK